MISQIVFIEEQLSELEAEIARLLTEINQVITTIIGIGNTLGGTVVRISTLCGRNKFQEKAKNT